METAVEPAKKAKLIRLDKNLSEKSLDWLGIFERDAALCFDLIVYISNNAQLDIFKFGKIELSDFCRTMGYDKTNLQKKAEIPAQLELKSEKLGSALERSKKFITVFENALYKLGRFTIPIVSSSYDPESREYTLTTSFVQIIKELKIHVASSSANAKISYSYTTSDEFDYNLSRFFFFADLNMVKELREKNLLLLYFYLKNIESGHHHQFVERDFIKVCHFAGIAPSEENIKYTKKNLQTRKLSRLKEYIDFDFAPVNVTGRWKYGYAFTFHANKDYEKDRDKAIIAKADADYIDLKLIKYFIRRFKVKGAVEEKAYREWFFDKEQDYPKKKDILFTALAELHKKPKDQIAQRFGRYAEDFFSKKKK